MTQEEINEAIDVLCKVFDKAQEIIHLMNTLSAIERTKIEEIIKEEENDTGAI